MSLKKLYQWNAPQFIIQGNDRRDEFKQKSMRK